MKDILFGKCDSLFPTHIYDKWVDYSQVDSIIRNYLDPKQEKRIECKWLVQKRVCLECGLVDFRRIKI